MLIYRSDPSTYHKMSGEEKQAMMNDWKKWFEKLKEDDSLVDAGSPFTPTAKIISKEGVKNGPVKSGNTFISYYMIIQAEDFEMSVKIAQSSPAMEGGSIEVRELINMPF